MIPLRTVFSASPWIHIVVNSSSRSTFNVSNSPVLPAPLNKDASVLSDVELQYKAKPCGRVSALGGGRWIKVSQLLYFANLLNLALPKADPALEFDVPSFGTLPVQIFRGGSLAIGSQPNAPMYIPTHDENTTFVIGKI